MVNSLSKRLARRALRTAGSMRLLCARLAVDEDQVEAWLDGLPMPRGVLYRMVDFILDDHEAWISQDRREEPRPQPKKTTPQGGELRRPSKEELAGKIVPLRGHRAYRAGSDW